MSLIQWIASISATLGISVTVAIGAAWAAIRYFGDSWLKSRFEQALESFRSEKARELESFKFQSSRMLDRSAKFNQQEFEILPCLWDKMTTALSYTNSATNPAQMVPITIGMPHTQFISFISNLKIEDWEKDEIISLHPDYRDPEILKKLKWSALREAWHLHGEFHNYLIRHSVFIPKDLRSYFRELSDMNYDTLSEHNINLSICDQSTHHTFTKREIFQTKWLSGFENILSIIQGRLWIEGDTGSDIR